MNIIDQFKTIKALKYKEFSEGEVYNLIHIQGFKLGITIVKVLKKDKKDKKEVELEDLEKKITYKFTKKEYKKSWLLNKKMVS